MLPGLLAWVTEALEGPLLGKVGQDDEFGFSCVSLGKPRSRDKQAGLGPRTERMDLS